MSPAAPSVWPKQDFTDANVIHCKSASISILLAVNAWPSALTSIGSPNGVPTCSDEQNAMLKFFGRQAIAKGVAKDDTHQCNSL